jgi:endonuclease VIII
MEGPSLVILKEELAPFVGKRVRQASGNAAFGPKLLERQTLKKVRSWGKHLLLTFEKISLRIHFLMFGSYRIDDRRDREPRLRLNFPKGEIDFYSCSVKPISAEDLREYDWEINIMSTEWNPRRALKRLKEKPKIMVCDALMDQTIFAGVGNIIKNEALFNLRLHPESVVGALTPTQLKALVREARDYSRQFYEWKKALVLKRHWQVFRKPKCPSCGSRVSKRKTGALERVSFFCPLCQPPLHVGLRKAS